MKSLMKRLSPERLLDELADVDDLLIVQDLDGVCMQLVKDPSQVSLLLLTVLLLASDLALLIFSPVRRARDAKPLW